LSALPLFFGISVLRSSSPEFSAMLISTMALHATRGLGYEIPLRAQKPKGAGLIGQFLAEGLPGVGPSTARKLLEHFGTPRALFQASPDGLRAVRGIGPKLASDITEALDASHRDWVSTKARAKR
jgi:Fanconi anemia group M protein